MDTLEPDACRPCRGTGRVTSTEGGTAHEVTCPWCGGTGTRPAVATAPGDEDNS